MKAAKVTLLYSNEYWSIHEWFHNTRPPYGFLDILQFNRLYKQAYPRMSREERRRVEEWVDEMIVNVENPRLAKKIFGVV